jgi:hypothetical protein
MCQHHPQAEPFQPEEEEEEEADDSSQQQQQQQQSGEQPNPAAPAAVKPIPVVIRPKGFIPGAKPQQAKAAAAAAGPKKPGSAAETAAAASGGSGSGSAAAERAAALMQEFAQPVAAAAAASSGAKRVVKVSRQGGVASGLGHVVSGAVIHVVSGAGRRVHTAFKVCLEAVCVSDTGSKLRSELVLAVSSGHCATGS